MFKGRKVTDPVVQGGGPSQYNTGLNKAWDTVGKAKSELRKIEARLDDVDRQPIPGVLNLTEETTITDYTSLGAAQNNNETYKVGNEYASGVTVDNYGRSAYLKSQAHTQSSHKEAQSSRKISRLGDKYVEENDVAVDRKKKPSSSKEAGSNGLASLKKKSAPPIQLQEKKYGTHDGQSHKTRGVNSRHVEFSDHVRVRETRDKNGRLNNGYSDPRIGGSLLEEQSTLTNSRDIRETEINFLNNNLTRDFEPTRRTGVESGLTHVSVTVPGSSRHSTKSVNSAGSRKSRFLDLVPESADMDGRISDTSHSDSESGRGRKFKGIKSLDPDGLAKIKETIRKQQSKSSAKDHNNEDIDDSPGSLGANPRSLHDPCEPIMPRSQELIEGAEKTAKVRKVAAGPAAPSYKGFSETEVKYRIVESKPGRGPDSGKKDKKRQVSLKVQDKRIDPFGTWLTVEEGEGKSKKVTRVIAPSRKPQKQHQQQQQQQQPKNKEIITTSSWRAGQELVLRELGPAKKSSSGKSKHRDTEDIHSDDDVPFERPETQGGDDFMTGATATELQQHRVLSEEAKRVYSDLQMEDDHPQSYGGGSLGVASMGEREKRWKAPVKRKAPKTTETEKQQQSSAKQRHYDAEQIRKYMQRQKADRVRQQKEEEHRRKEEEEARRKHLEELYNKQKHASSHSAAQGKKERARQKQVLEAMHAAGLVGEVPRNKLSEHARALLSVENKENHLDNDEMDISDSSSTLTGDGSDNDTPNATPRRSKMDIDGSGNTRSAANNRDILKPTRQKNVEKPNQMNVRTIGDFSFDVGNVTSKFTQALQEKLNQEPNSLASGYNGVNGDNYLSDANRLNDGLPRSRADRIQAIKDTAATLQNRLKEEARKIQAQTNSNTETGATSKSSVRWNDSEPSNKPAPREQEFMSRYEQLTGANGNYSVFNSNLPGNQVPLHTAEPTVPVVAPRQTKTGSNMNTDFEDTTITETSTFSEITLTDESDNEDLMGGKIGTGLRKTDYHSSSRPDPSSSQPPSIPRPSQHPAPRVANSWDETTPDDYNVFSIYSRRHQERMVRPGREPMSTTRRKSPIPNSEPETKPATQTPTSSKPIPSVRASRGPAIRSRSPADGMGQTVSESLRSQSPGLKSKSRGTARYEDRSEDDEDTLGEESYTQTFESEDIAASRARSVETSAPVASQKSAVTSQRSAPQKSSMSRKPDRMSPEMDSSMGEDISQEEVTPRAERPNPLDSEPAQAPRLSPNSLEQKFYNALNDLESMEMSIKQLSSVDRTRAVAMAQQETVSLAQMLKAKQQAHDQQMKEIQLKAKAEANESTKQLEDYRKRASETVFKTADEIAKVREEGATSIPEVTRKLIESQTAAVKALTKAVKAVPGVGEGARPKTSVKRRSDEGNENDDTESLDDYSIDETMTEDEREEKSFSIILPSKSHRNRVKTHHQHSDNESVTSEASSTHLKDLHSLFAGEEGFDKFTEEMVKQFMKEEEVRAQHQASLLKLRESALVEKTKAELQWLEQQKQQRRNKGADDSFPQIKKRQRGLKLKLQEQQEEIKRLREESKAAAKERQRKLYEEISKRQASRNARGPLIGKGRLGRPSEVHTEAELDGGSDVEKKKDYKSDSEIYTDPKSLARKNKHEIKDMKKYQLDEKNLTARQQRLMERRKNAEDLLKWKKMLDNEENRVFKLEKRALKVWDSKEKKYVSKKETSQSVAAVSRDDTEKPSTKRDNGTTKDSTIKTASVSHTVDRDSTVVSENITTARDESLYTTIKEDLPSASMEDKHSRMMNDASNLKQHNRSGSESSDIHSVSSDYKRTNESSDDTMTNSYGNETFEDTVTTTHTKTTSRANNKKGNRSPLDSLKKMSLSSPRSPRTKLRTHASRNSESESEDSFSDTKSTSELSDFEGRIRALNEELKKRKSEAERLKIERKKRKKEDLKTKEETLKKQLESYDKQIKSLKVELKREIAQDQPSPTAVRPQIKKPQVSPKTTPRKQRPDLDSSGPDSTHVSPASIDESKQTPPKASPTLQTTPVKSQKSLDRISEGSESITTRSEQSESSYKEKVQSIKDLVSDIDKTEDIEEEVDEELISAASEASEDKSEIMIDLKSAVKEDIYDVSEKHEREPTVDDSVGYDYTEDFTATDHLNTATKEDKLKLSFNKSELSEIADDIESKPLTGRSGTEISEAITEHLPSMSASEPFVKQLDLKIGGKEKLDSESKHDLYSEQFEIESDGDMEKSSIVGSSRPSSGRSERSSTYTEHETSESDKSPSVIADQPGFVEAEDVSEPKVTTKPAKVFTDKNILDIDDLLGTPEELTPIPSPREDTPGGQSESSRLSNFFDPLGDFEIGDRVSVTAPTGERSFGTLLFKGNVQFAPGIWAGVELEEPVGRHDGIEDGVRYFNCKKKHGLIVPGHDIQHFIEDEIVEDDNINVRASIESTSSVNTEDGELLKAMNEAASNVELFEESPQPSPRPAKVQVDKETAKADKEKLADKITDQLMDKLLRNEMQTLGNRNTKRGPPVAPKPKSKTPPTSMAEEHPETNGDIDGLEDFLRLETSDQLPDADVRPTSQQVNDNTVDHSTDNTLNYMVNEAFDKMLDIRNNKKRGQVQELTKEEENEFDKDILDLIGEEPLDHDSRARDQDQEDARESGIFEDEMGPVELERVLNEPDRSDQHEGPPRPGSPVPGLHSPKDSLKPLEESGTFEDDDFWPERKDPPPYPGQDAGLPREYKKLAEEVFYAVPHEEKEVAGIVGDAVDEFWQQRRYGESLTDLQPSQGFYTQEETGSDLISNSRRVFKKLLFDLTGEVMRNIYREEEYDSPVAWHKPKRKANKFYRGLTPPSTVEILKPVVQKAVVDILGLNGAKKGMEKNKWGIRKKKDLVDSILVQELREEEPEWINYDEDELAVKMQLTETLFDSLLNDTVQTMNKIFRKKQILQEQRKSEV
ncbi:centrosome-associated protein 350-like isoform X3 [Mya arenaria]|uniref:centrosome-associated protein 350-like isoform X3 n=1 Tax=Mya arenaria TaxID=6604 RepID=UPI0022DEC899|nr:centrosome-associated protein 350-like isoform X3 [Mya arenaria]